MPPMTEAGSWLSPGARNSIQALYICDRNPNTGALNAVSPGSHQQKARIESQSWAPNPSTPTKDAGIPTTHSLTPNQPIFTYKGQFTFLELMSQINRCKCVQCSKALYDIYDNYPNYLFKNRPAKSGLLYLHRAFILEKSSCKATSFKVEVTMPSPSELHLLLPPLKSLTRNSQM